MLDNLSPAMSVRETWMLMMDEQSYKPTQD